MRINVMATKFHGQMVVMVAIVAVIPQAAANKQTVSPMEDTWRDAPFLPSFLLVIRSISCVVEWRCAATQYATENEALQCGPPQRRAQAILHGPASKSSSSSKESPSIHGLFKLVSIGSVGISLSIHAMDIRSCLQ